MDENNYMKIQSLSELEVTHFENILKKICSKLSIIYPDKVQTLNEVYIKSLIVFLTFKRKGFLSISNLAKKCKKTIYREKINWEDSSSLIIKIFRMIALELILKEKLFEPFFNDKIKEETKNYQYSNEVTVKMKNLWKKEIKTPPRNAEEVVKTRKIKIFPTKEQKKMLTKWFNHAQYTYNLAIENIREKGLRSWMTIRNEIVTAKKYFCQECNIYTGKVKNCKECGSKPIMKVNENFNKELESTPKHIRLSSVKNLCTNFKTNIEKIKKGQIGKFNINFKSKKKLRSDSIEVEASSCKLNDKNIIIYSNSFNLKKASLPFRKVIMNPKINYNYLTKEYFLCVPYLEKSWNKYPKEGKTIALDPGVKTFCTGYDSSNGDCINFNIRLETLEKLKKKISLMQSHSKNPQKHYTKINNIISDTHWRFVTYLTRNYDEIILPHFKSQEMVKDNCSKFNEILINFNRHYQFAQKLEWKCLSLNKKLIRINEAYTTQTCGLCGKLAKLDLNDRIFNCIDKGCPMKNIDRDYHAARNIFLKARFC